MDALKHDYPWKIQRLTALVALLINGVAILSNILTPAHPLQRSVNILGILSITCLLVFSLFIDHRFMRLIQVLVFLLVGIFTIFVDSSNRLIGDILCIIGILLAFSYRFFTPHAPGTLEAGIGIMVCLRIFFGLAPPRGGNSAEVVNSSISTALILFLVTLLKKDLFRFLEESRRNELYTRIGMNITGFAHGLDLGTAMNLVRSLKEKLSAGNRDATWEQACSLEKLLLQKNRMKNQLLYTVEQNSIRESRDVDLHKALSAVTDILFLDRKVMQRIRINRCFYPEKITVNANPFEIHFILHNLISNAINAMLVQEGEHFLQLSTRRAGNRGILSIADNGPGFLPGDIGEGGFGLFYSLTMLKHNGVKVEFQNRPQGGTSVTLDFLLAGEEI